MEGCQRTVVPSATMTTQTSRIVCDSNPCGRETYERRLVRLPPTACLISRHVRGYATYHEPSGRPTLWPSLFRKDAGTPKKVEDCGALRVWRRCSGRLRGRRRVSHWSCGAGWMSKDSLPLRLVIVLGPPGKEVPDRSCAELALDICQSLARDGPSLQEG